MRLLRGVAICLAGSSLASCKAGTEPTRWSYEQGIGLAVVMADGACLTMETPSVPLNTRVSVVDTVGQRSLPAVVVAARASCVTDVTPGLHGYQMRFDGSLPQTPFIGIAVVDDAARFGMRGPSLTSDLDRDGHDEFFRSCTSGEGVHATIWSDAPLTGPRRWHRYHALGYDVSPTCTPAEASEP
jgi:hypothetical protein